MSEEDLEIHFKGTNISFRNMFKVLDPETLNGSYELIDYEQNYREGYSKEIFHLKFPNIKDFFNSSGWGRRKIEVLEQSKYICQLCGKSSSNFVSHKNDLLIIPELCLTLNNLLVLCKECFHKFHIPHRDNEKP